MFRQALACSIVAALLSCGGSARLPTTTSTSATSTTPLVFPPPVPILHRLDASRQGSALLLADLDGRRVAYIADEDEHAVRVVDVETERELSAIALGGTPASMVMLADGRLVVAVRSTSKLLVLRGGSPLVVDAEIDVAAEPIGLALTPDDATLLATSGWGRTVTVFDAHTFTRKTSFAVAREPRTVVIGHDGKHAFVAHAVGSSIDVLPLDGSPAPKPLGVAGTEEISGRGAMMGMQNRVACQGFALAKSEAGRIFAPHVLVFPGPPEVSSGYGGGEGRESEVFHVPVIDEDSGKLLAESRQLRADIFGSSRCALPRAATVGKDGLYVSCLGENTVMLLDADAVNPHDVELKKWSVPAGPTAIALDEEHDRALVWSQFAHALTTIALASARPFSLSSATLPRKIDDARLERGRLLFHATTDRRISGDGRACASCHPEGRDDTLVWSSPKGPRQTPMLAGRLDGAAPFGWNGDAPDVAKHLVQTVKRLGGSGIDGEDKDALMAYVRSLSGPVHRAPRTDAIERGQAIFQSEQAGCASCHGPTGDLPDGSLHDVKSQGMGDLQSKFDTPSLRFVGGSAPYFHDGRYPDLRTLLVKSDGKMGHTKHLSPAELADLTAFLEAL